MKNDTDIFVNIDKNLFLKIHKDKEGICKLSIVYRHSNPPEDSTLHECEIPNAEINTVVMEEAFKALVEAKQQEKEGDNADN